MKFLSNIEFEELGRAVGEQIRESFPEFITQVSKQTNDGEENIIEKLVEAKMLELLKNMDNRSANWGMELAPIEYLSIEKRLMEPARKDDDVAIQLQEFNDDIYLLTKAAQQPLSQLRSYETYKKQWSELAKALNISTAGQGAEWMPTGFSSQMIEFTEIEARVAQIFETFPMPTSPYTPPVLLNDGTAYKGGQDTSDDPAMITASTPGTSNLTFTAVPIVANYPIMDDAQEDAIVPLLSVMKRSIARAIAKGRDDAIINGQLTAALDTGDSISDTDVRKCWDGLRYLTQSTLKQTGTTWSTTAGLALFRALKEDMGVYSLAPEDLAVLANANMINKFRALAEVSTDDKFGSAATIHNGKLTHIDGSEIVPTQHVRENVNTTGIYDGTTVTKTQYLVVHKPSFKRGTRRNFTLETERVVRKQVTYLVATAREHWKAIYDTATEPVIGWQFNITK